MKRLSILNTHVKKSRFLTFIVGYLILFAFGLFVSNQWTEFRNNQELARIEQAPLSEWFLYESVEYVGMHEDGGLKFNSQRKAFQTVDVVWLDQLVCDSNDDSRFTIFSIQQDPGKLDRGSRTDSDWRWREGYPLDTTCYMDSVIDAPGLQKSQKVISEPFTTPKE